MIDDCTGLVFAGGDSRRMGRDKATLEFNGQTLLQRAVDLTRSLFPQVWVSVRAPRADIAASATSATSAVMQVFDELPNAGPLAGLCAGLAKSQTPWVFALAVDMPFMESGAILKLAARRENDADAVVPVVEDVPQPLAAFYATSALPALRAVLSEPGKHGLRDALKRLKAIYIREDRPRGFADLDTPEDVAVNTGTPFVVCCLRHP